MRLSSESSSTILMSRDSSAVKRHRASSTDCGSCTHFCLFTYLGFLIYTVQTRVKLTTTSPSLKMTRRLNRNKRNAMLKNKHKTNHRCCPSHSANYNQPDRWEFNTVQVFGLVNKTGHWIYSWHRRGRRRLSKRFVTMTAASCNHTCRVLCKSFSAKPKNYNFVQVSYGKDSDRLTANLYASYIVLSEILHLIFTSVSTLKSHFKLILIWAPSHLHHKVTFNFYMVKYFKTSSNCCLHWRCQLNINLNAGPFRITSVGQLLQN